MLQYFYRITEWFKDLSDRRRLIMEFNNESKTAFIEGYAMTLLEARITRGDSSYRHEFSKFMAGGFRIKVLSGKPLTSSDMKDVGMIILSNDVLVRRLMSMGWDTLEIHDSIGSNGLKWQLKKYSNIGGMLSC